MGQNVEEALEYNPTLEGMPNTNLAMRAYHFYLKFDSIEEAVDAVPFPTVKNGRFDPDYIQIVSELFGEKEAKIMERSFNA